MKRIEAACVGVPGRTLATVVRPETIAGTWQPDLTYLVKIANPDAATMLARLHQSGATNVLPLIPFDDSRPAASRYVQAAHELIEDDDVVALDPAHRHAEVLARKSDYHHTVFLTNRCNSRCIMCSQPPTPQDDRWRVEEALQLARQMTFSPQVLGFSGGEPLLLGDELRAILDAFQASHPYTRLEVLTNGRDAGSDTFAERLFRNLRGVTWMVPLYGHAPFLHDYVVQARGAFDETLCGLLNLQRWSQPIQLRTVLVEPVLANLPDLCDFIALNLPFVREVALMATEPVGYALGNPEECAVNLRDWMPVIRSGVRRLTRGGVRAILLNTPLCAIDMDLWPHAHRSISDWKQTYAPACEPCRVRERCCGLFASSVRGWTPAPIRPIMSTVS